MDQKADRIKLNGLKLISEWIRTQYPEATAANIRVLCDSHSIQLEFNPQDTNKKLDGSEIIRLGEGFSA